MDKTSKHHTMSLMRVSQDFDVNVNAGSSKYALPALRVDSPGDSTRRSKRKWEMNDGSSLVLGLGQSLSSCTTISSAKEIEDESSIDLGLSIDLLGNNKVPDPKKGSNATKGTFELRSSELDLELSLSTGPVESDITSVAQGSSAGWNGAEALASAAKHQFLDEGSISSRWKCGPLVHSLQIQETTVQVNQVHDHNYPISVIPNISTPAVVTSKDLRTSTSRAACQQRRTNVKTCQFDGCTRGARGASGFCIAHGGGRRCQRVGCPKGAEGKTVFCKAHGGGRRCQYLGCTKSAEGCTEYCIAHGGGRRCSHEGCARAARGKSGLCIRHGGGKRCKMDNCIRSAEGISGLCISHGGGRRCHYPSCTKGAQGSTMYCKSHGGGKRCTYLGCMKGAEGSTPFCKGHGGGKRCTSEGCTKSVHGGTLFCVGHGGGKRCAMHGCTRSARGRTDFCVRHGGGKRCKHEGCTKSAQGSTDFCKAHGGGKRCSWGQVGSEIGGEAAVPCDKFARGKSGLCASHAAETEERMTHARAAIAITVQELESRPVDKMKGALELSSVTAADGGCLDQFSLPEGRVHGGSLMALLGVGTSFQTSNNGLRSQSKLGKSPQMSQSWL